jgi:endo-1,4-beta-xylanase
MRGSYEYKDPLMTPSQSSGTGYADYISSHTACHVIIMIAFTYLTVAAAAISGALAAPAAAAYGPDLPDFEVGSQNLARRQDYNQNYKTGGNVNFSPTNNGYSVSFSGAGDFVVGKGWKTGTAR